MKALKNSILSFVFISLSMFGLTALAQTPDGETPANEGVCDELIGMKPGLYGLCVAFCEAQDAEATFDTATGEVTFAEGTRPSDPMLLEMYNRKRGVDGPPMPCVNVTVNECPCWTEAEIAAFPSPTGVAYCSDEPQYTEMTLFDPVFNRVAATVIEGGGECFYWRGEETTAVIRNFAITTEEALICKHSIRAACTARGLQF